MSFIIAIIIVGIVGSADESKATLPHARAICRLVRGILGAFGVHPLDLRIVRLRAAACGLLRVLRASRLGGPCVVLGGWFG